MKGRSGVDEAGLTFDGASKLGVYEFFEIQRPDPGLSKESSPQPLTIYHHAGVQKYLHKLLIKPNWNKLTEGNGKVFWGALAFR